MKKFNTKLSKSKQKKREGDDFDNYLDKIEENIDNMHKEMNDKLFFLKTQKLAKAAEIDKRKFRDTSLNQRKLDAIVAERIEKLKTGNPANYMAWDCISNSAKKILARKGHKRLGNLVRAFDSHIL